MATVSSRGSTRLPSLDTPEHHARMRERSPADLRGANFSKIQDSKHKRGTNEKVVFLPILDGKEDHPAPYYATAEITLPALAEVPWVADEKRKMKAQADRFNRDRRLQDALLGEMIGDTIQEEITAVASIVLEESKYEEETDRYVVGMVEEVFVMPEVQFQVYLTVWSLLYDLGRNLPQEEFLKLKEKDDKLNLDSMAKKALLAHVLEGKDWAEDLKEEKVLSEITWDKLVYNYHRNLQENALANNVAMKFLQEKVIAAGIEAELVEGELLELMEKDLTTFDEMEKLTTPPRRG